MSRRGVTIGPGDVDAADVLARSRDAVEPALRAAVETLSPAVRRVAGYHLGWWDGDERPVSDGGGKSLRPALTLLAAEAVGGDASRAVPAAVAVELVHNFSLLHDDVLDGDEQRRHRPTAWRVFGRAAAILAGDALVALAQEVVAASGHPAALAGTRMVNAAVLALVDGQVADVDFEQRDDVALAECLRMVENKTGALLGCATAVGALFGDARPEQLTGLRGFGDQVGVAFQFADDLLGIWGDPAVTGKPVYADLRRRKKSLPVVAALTGGTPAGHELAKRYLGASHQTDADLVRMAELVEAAGARTWCQAQAEELLAGAQRQLAAVDPQPRAGAELCAVAALATRRDR